MIYLDHAATSFPRPERVIRAVERCLREHPLPTRIVWGSNDVYFGDEHERLLVAMPTADVVHIPSGGHFPQEDAPDPTHEAILGWVHARGDR